MTFIPRAQEIYKHFKGNLYQIVTVAEHTETGEAMVIYQAMYGEFKVYARPLAMFCSEVDKEKYPNVKQKYRFELQKSWSPVGEAEITEAFQESCISESAQVVEKSTEQVLKSETDMEAKQAFVTEEEPALDPMLLAFLDAETYVEKLNILAGMHHRITDDMITTMAIASDIEIPEGDLENRYLQLKNCLLTLDKYEINRLR